MIAALIILYVCIKQQSPLASQLHSYVHSMLIALQGHLPELQVTSQLHQISSTPASGAACTSDKDWYIGVVIFSPT